MVQNNKLKMIGIYDKVEVVAFNTENFEKEAKKIYRFLSGNVCIGIFDELNKKFEERTKL